MSHNHKPRENDPLGPCAYCDKPILRVGPDDYVLDPGVPVTKASEMAIASLLTVRVSDLVAAETEQQRKPSAKLSQEILKMTSEIEGIQAALGAVQAVVGA